MKKLIVSGVLGLMLFASVAFAQISPPATFTWSAPTTGTAVVEYVVELSIDGGAWTQVAVTTTNQHTFSDFVYLTTYEVRVAGVDASDRQGPFSVPSDPYTPDQGVPGAPSKPVIIQL
jgi:hypothetical protein